MFKHALWPVRGAYYGTLNPSRKALPGSSWVLPRQPRGGPGGAPAAWPSVRWGVWARSASGPVLSEGRRTTPSRLPLRARHTFSAFNKPSPESVYTRKSHKKKTRDYCHHSGRVFCQKKYIFFITTSVPARGHKFPSSPGILNRTHFESPETLP